MGTKVDCKSYLPGYKNYHHNFMRDLNEDSSSSSWPACYGDNNTTTYGPYYNGFMPRATTDGYPGYGKDAMKQKMLEHEAIFKNQVHELHRLYRIQRDMMEEFKRKELYRLRASMEPSSSSNFISQIQSQDPRKWHMAGFTLINSGYESRTSITGAEIENSPVSFTKGYNIAQPSKEYEPLDLRPLKVRKRLLDLQLPADEYIDTEESEKKSSAGIRLADLNEPVEIEEEMTPSTVDFLDHYSINGVKKSENRDGPLVKSPINERGLNERGWLSHLYEAGSSKTNLSSATHGLHKEKMAILSHPAPGKLNRGPDLGSLFGPSGFASRPGSVTSWASPMSTHTQKVTTMESRLDTPTNSHTLGQLGEKCLVNGSSNVNPIFRGEISARNGFYQGSASKSNKETNVSANHVLWNNSKPVIDIDLNEAEEHPAALPWLKCGPDRGNGPTITDLNQRSSDCEIMATTKIETQNVKKILGFPIFRTQSVQSASEKRNGTIKIDINLECEPPEEEIPTDELIMEKEVKKQTDAPFLRDYIDLNSCVSDFEEANDSSVKIASGIDLDQEAPVENEDVDASFQLLQIKKNEILNAAEIMVTISSSCPDVGHSHPPDNKATLDESLIWFVDAVSDELEKSILDDPSPIEMDDFEAMTLEIPETKEEEYMPAPFVPEEARPSSNSTLVARPRRGQSRRGRQRRDFQRDILPGLVSLSRHEVTEDIKMFSGLMRATGHHWVSGLSRRNGGGRGRRRAVAESVSAVSCSNNRACQAPSAVQNNNNIVVEGGVLEDRSLTGWGKKTRRPRRQRCPTGNNNPPAVVLT